MKNLPPSLKKILNKEKKHKFGAVRTTCLYGHNHDSRKEAMWCLKLHEMQKECLIKNLRMEPVYNLVVNDLLVCKHLPDFDYDVKQGDGWRTEVVDVKGNWDGGKRPEWRLKHRLFCVLYPAIKYLVV